VPNGLDVEKVLFERLEAAGFRLAPYHEKADLEHKVDRVVLGPPPQDSPFWMEPAMAVQVTLRGSNWQKMWTFQEAAARVAPRLVYIELELAGELTEEATQVVVAALYHLYYAAAAPQHAWINVTESKFRVGDLDATLSPYNAWLATSLPNDIRGRINHWRPTDQYGFMQGSVPGPTGEPEMPFYFRLSDVTDPQLVEILGKFNGDIPFEQQPWIIFNDAGPATDYPRKAAKNLHMAPSLATPPAPAPAPT